MTGRRAALRKSRGDISRRAVWSWVCVIALLVAPAAAGSRTERPREACWVFFADRGLVSAAQEREALRAASDALSPRTRARRAKVGAEINLLDLPPSSAYVDQIRATGAELRVVSPWLNAVSVNVDPQQKRAIASLPFVTRVQAVGASPSRQKLAEPVEPVELGDSAGDLRSLDYGDCSSQILPIQVDQLHDAGYSGAGVLVCVLDTGFLRTHDCLDSVDVLAERDFVQGDGVTSNQAGDVTTQHNHGTNVLSLLGGRDPGNLIGPAFGASFALGKTENLASETPIEEDYWAAGAQWADSLGADVISSSLAYFDWYTTADLDGNTAVVTIAADLAVSNGICVFNSAGNEGDDPWFFITPPADGDSVVAVGAVDSLGVITNFSSRGPTADARIKPDVCAMGRGNLVALPTDNHGYGRGSGTSFACPLVAGVAALLLEAHPAWGPLEVRDALRTTATNASSPDSVYGWGIVQAWDAAALATAAPPAVTLPARDVAVWASPNPARGATAFRFAMPAALGRADVEIVDVSGRRVRMLARGVELAASGAIDWDGADDAGARVTAGVYFARVTTGLGSVVARVVQLR